MPVARKVWRQVEEGSPASKALRLFFYRDLYVWLDNPFQAPPALARLHDDPQQLAISWQAGKLDSRKAA